MPLVDGEDEISGASLIAATLIEKDWVSVSEPSLTCTVTSALQSLAPFSVGVQLITPVAASMFMPAGACVSDQLSVSPSMSSAVTPYWYATSSLAVVTAAEVITGASLTPPTVMVHDWVAGAAPFSPPSATCTVTSALLTPLPGVQVTRPVAEMLMPLGACVSEKERSVPLLASSGSLTATW